jgi:hypothetical protein
MTLLAFPSMRNEAGLPVTMAGNGIGVVGQALAARTGAVPD